MCKRGPAGATLGNPPPRPPTRRERRAAMGQGRSKGGETEAGGKYERQNLGSVGHSGGLATPVVAPHS